MLAVGHALSGWCGGLLIAAAVGAPTPLALTVATASAGAALLPDLDHPGSTASTAFGPLSGLTHRGVLLLHHGACIATRQPSDRGKPPGAHRGVTHWWPFPIVAGVGVGELCAHWPVAVLVTLAVLFTLAVRGLSIPEYRAKQSDSLGRRVRRGTAHRVAGLVPTITALRFLRRQVAKAGKPAVMLAAGCAAWLAVENGQAAQLGPWLGVIVGGGMVLHILGDAPTESGLPGVRLWKNWRLPRWLAFKAGGGFEVLAVWVPLSLLAVLLVPGVWPAVVAGWNGS